MKKLTKEELIDILEKHQHWLYTDCDGFSGMKADLSNTDLSGIDFTTLMPQRPDLIAIDFSNSDFSNSDLSYCFMNDATLINANFTNACLKHTYLIRANCTGANFNNTDLRFTDFHNTNLSNAKNLISTIDYLKSNFEFTSEGIIAYKIFNLAHKTPNYWKIEPGNVIEEVCLSDRAIPCGCGINVATFSYLKQHGYGTIWKLLIRWEWLPGVVVPYNTDGQIRCEKAEIIERVEIR